MDTWIGVDLGGTHLRAALVDEQGTILHARKTETMAYEGVHAVLGRVADAIRTLPGWAAAKGIGIGVPGGVLRDGDTVVLASNLKGFDGFPVRSHLSLMMRLPVALENDGNMACLAESLLGAGKGMQTVVYITLSTGIGGGVYVNGQLLRGAHGCAGEFGCIAGGSTRARYGDLPPGAIESEASGSALIRRAEELLHRPFSNAGEIIALAASGHMALSELLHGAVAELAATLSNIASVLDPDIFVLGGGLMKSGDYLLPRLTACYRDFAHPVYRDTPIAQGTLAEPGLIGAALYARSMLS